jgi:DNA-binding NarL/FixJ family response regulator
MNLPTDFTETTGARRPFASGRDGMAGPDPMDDQPPRDHRRSLLIADDDALVLYRLLRSEMLDSFRIVAVAQNATDAIALAEQHQPDAALIDVEMPGGGARAAVPAIALCSPNTRMVILLADEIHHVVVELLAAGAMAFVRKGVGGDRMAGTLAQALLVEV